jgi:hypothetical protein
LPGNAVTRLANTLAAVGCTKKDELMVNAQARQVQTILIHCIVPGMNYDLPVNVYSSLETELSATFSWMPRYLGGFNPFITKWD